jgi:CIC family chloride channel protein
MELLVPLLTASVAAYAVTVLLLRRSILTEKIARRGHHITREYGIDPYELTRVSDVMVRDVDVLPADMSIPEAVAERQKGRHRIYPVVDSAGRPVGPVTRADALLWTIEGGHDRERLAERISDGSLTVVHAGDVVTRAVDMMLATGFGRIPVVDPATGVLVGMVTRKDLLQVRARVARTETERRIFFGARGTRTV